MIGADSLRQEIEALEQGRANSTAIVNAHQQQLVMIEGALQVLRRLLAEAEAPSADPEVVLATADETAIGTGE